ncbi:hypothetical protein NMG60_11025595 [Bertholletia excelsa]
MGNPDRKRRPLFRSSHVQSIFAYLLLIILYQDQATKVVSDYDKTNMHLGVILNMDSLTGKQMGTAMKLAVHNFNKRSLHHCVSLHIQNSHASPLQASRAAEQLIQKEGVEVLVGMETWHETALVAEIGNKAKRPVLSFAPSPIESPFSQSEWPFLVQMSSNANEQLRCVAAIIRSFQWKRVITIQESNIFGGDRGGLPHWLNSLEVSKDVIRDKLANLLGKRSRVFIPLDSSLSMATHFFQEARQMGLMAKDSAWIITEDITSLLDSANASFISSLEGALGIRTYFSESSKPFLSFKRQFRQMFQIEYPEEDILDPTIHALRAFDSMNMLTDAIHSLSSNRSTPTEVLKSILSTSFTGLSGNICFHGGEPCDSPALLVVNVIGKRYKELGFWSSNFGFSKSPVWKEIEKADSSSSGNDNMKVWSDVLTWPGNLKRIPKGWSMPTEGSRLRIGVQASATFHNFVKVEPVKNSSRMSYSGFCIDVFDEVLKIVEESYPLPYDFIPYIGSYNSLIEHLINKTFDAVIGDVTILANRSKYVDFTQPFAESCLTMLVLSKPRGKRAWTLFKPFTKEMWAATLGAAFSFVYTSLLYSHREKLHSGYTRLVVLIWLFLSLVISSSYTASLSSMLTVSKLEPNVKDVEWLKRHNANVACDGIRETFVSRYLVDIIHFSPKNIKFVGHEYDYPNELKSGNISAAFVELPYGKAFSRSTTARTTMLWNFLIDLEDLAFQKGSPIVADFSTAILTLKQKGRLKQLEEEWYAPPKECLAPQTASDTTSLSLQFFWGLYIFSAITSTLCYLLFAVRRCFERCHGAKLVRLKSCFHK